MTKQKQTEREQAFRSSVRSMGLRDQVRLLLKMRDCLGQPEPVRVWCVVQDTGGCVVWANGEPERG